jgi:N-acetylglucosamine-6-sulfatase
MLLALLFAVAPAAMACADETPAQKPNVLLVMADDLDTKSFERNLNAYPNLRALMNRGVYFKNSYVSFPVCCPSRATTLSGDYPHTHGVWGNNLDKGGGVVNFHDDEPQALPTWFDPGYRTGLIGLYMNGYDDSYTPPGWDVWKPGYGTTGLGVAGFSKNGRNAAGMTDTQFYGNAGVDFINSSQGSPFFLYWAPHAPHLPSSHPARYERLYKDRSPATLGENNVSDKPPWIRELRRFGAKDKSAINYRYQNWIRSTKDVDAQVGKMMRALERNGQLDNTYIIVTSDNGFHFGEHRIPAGKWTPYEEATRVPLIIAGSGVTEGVSSNLVLNNDLAPTIADLTNSTPPYDPDGHSLGKLLNHPNAGQWRERILIEARGTGSGGKVKKMPGWKQLHTERISWTQYDGGARELYQLKADPRQLDNKASKASPGFKANLSKRVAALARCNGASCHAAEGF